MLKRTVSQIVQIVHNNRVVRDGIATLAIKLSSAVLSYAMFVIIAKPLSLAEFGQFGFSFALAITMANIAALGTSTSLLRFVPQYLASHQPELAKGYVTSTLKRVAVSSLVTASCIVLGTYNFQLVRPDLNYFYVYLAAPFVLVIVASDYSSTLLRALGRVATSQIPKDILWRMLVCLTVFAAMYFGLGQTAVSTITVCAVLLALMVLLQIFTGWEELRVFLSARSDHSGKTSWYRAMLPIWGISSLTILFQQFDVVMLGFMGFTDDSGPYFAALRTASLLSLLLIAGNLAAAPTIAALYHAGKLAELEMTIRHLAAGVGLPTLLGLGFLGLTGGWLLHLFDADFVSAYWILMILACGYALDAAAGPTAFLLQMTGHEKTYFKILLVSYALVILLQVLLIPYFGLLGAAIPNAIGMGTAAGLAIWKTRRYLGIDPSLLAFFRHGKLR